MRKFSESFFKSRCFLKADVGVRSVRLNAMDAKREAMAAVNIEAHGPVAVLRLDNGVPNAIGSAVLQELEQLLAEVRKQFRGLVLAGNPKFFSIGLDLPELLAFDSDGMADFWHRYENLVLDLYTLPVPTAAALAGHANGGGAILALACDYRFIAEGRKLISLNEVAIGVPVPYLADLLLRQIAGDRAAVEIEYESKLVPPEEARAIGLVDAVCSPGEVEAAAVEKVTRLAAMPGRAFAMTKQHRVREIPAKFKAVRPELDRAFMECWFTPETLTLLREAAKKF
jgi:enoyl-CoA hydratase/carnithine racemase